MLGAVLRQSSARLWGGRSAVIRGSAVPVSQSLVSRRWQCSKAEADKTPDAGQPFKVPGHKPTNFEKKILLWAGRFKKESDIPEFVSLETVDAAKSKVRIKVSMIMIFMTLVGCVIMIISGKRAAGRHETLSRTNLERKARLRNESEN